MMSRAWPAPDTPSLGVSTITGTPWVVGWASSLAKAAGPGLPAPTLAAEWAPHPMREVLARRVRARRWRRRRPVPPMWS
ncbi:MAG: hypothetical protein E6G35_11200 [Actinobacteria bacterium]|nr:MAG: hypothetical protein E6G35_11200 [Actinomycetota bacterium]